MTYKELFQLQIIHEYSPDIIENISLIPTIETKSTIKKQQFLLKKTSRGISILVPKSNTKTEEILNFYVFPKSNEIIEVTKIEEAEDNTMMLFTNKTIGLEVNELTSQIVKKEEAVCVFQALAKITINTSKINTDVAVPAYQIPFKSKAIKWKYYFITNTNDKSLEITTRNEQLNFDELNFDDEKATALKFNFPGAKIKIFESRGLIPITKKPLKDISLLQDKGILINHLPNPKISDQGIQILKLM